MIILNISFSMKYRSSLINVLLEKWVTAGQTVHTNIHKERKVERIWAHHPRVLGLQITKSYSMVPEGQPGSSRESLCIAPGMEVSVPSSPPYHWDPRVCSSDTHVPLSFYHNKLNHCLPLLSQDCQLMGNLTLVCIRLSSTVIRTST